MASSTPSSASQNWLLRATTKLEKSIFRKVEYKYKSLINNYVNRIKELEERNNAWITEYEVLENMFFTQSRQFDDLQNKLEQFTKPEVAVKDVEKEVFKVKSWSEKNTLEEGKKRKLEFNKEVDEIAVLRDAPPSKILKSTPTLRPKPPSPGIPKTNITKTSRERSTSPKSSMPPESPKKNVLKRERSNSPPQPVTAAFPPVSPNKPFVVTGQRKKRKKEKDKKKT